MNRKKHWLRVVALGCGLSLVTGVAQATPFTNGSFELATVDPAGGFTRLGAGDTSITGWTVATGDIDYTGTLWQASNGIRSVDLDGAAAGSISQEFDTTAGTQYQVTFDLAGNPDSGPPIKTLLVSAASDFASFTFDFTGKTFTDMGYLSQSFSFTATAPTTTLTFTSLTGSGYGPVIDNVSVMTAAPPPVPEPSTMLLLGSGLAGLAMWRRRRQG